MKTAPLATRDAAQLVRDQQHGLAAWQRELDQRLARDPEAETDREAQMDARRHLAGLQRARSAMAACQSKSTRPASGDSPRAVVVHRNEWLRRRICASFAELGVQVIGEAEDGAVALAMAVVEQPEILVLEDRLPWLTPVEVVHEVHRFAPHTFVAVQLEDGSEAADMLEAGASAVFTRGTRPAELCTSCVDALATTQLQDTA
jgi:response regulator NasT